MPLLNLVPYPVSQSPTEVEYIMEFVIPANTRRLYESNLRGLVLSEDDFILPNLLVFTFEVSDGGGGWIPLPRETHPGPFVQAYLDDAGLGTWESFVISSTNAVGYKRGAVDARSSNFDIDLNIERVLPLIGSPPVDLPARFVVRLMWIYTAREPVAGAPSPPFSYISPLPAEQQLQHPYRFVHRTEVASLGFNAFFT